MGGVSDIACDDGGRLLVLQRVIENDSRSGRCNIILVVWLACGSCGSSVGWEAGYILIAVLVVVVPS